MAIYFGNEKVNPKGISKVFAGNTLVYQNKLYRELNYIDLDTGYWPGVVYNPSKSYSTNVQIITAVNQMAIGGTRSDNGIAAYLNATYQVAIRQGSQKKFSSRNTTTYPYVRINWNNPKASAYFLYEHGFDEQYAEVGTTSTSSVDTSVDAPKVELHRYHYSGGMGGELGVLRIFQFEEGIGVTLWVPSQRKSDGVIGLSNTSTGQFIACVNQAVPQTVSVKTENPSWSPVR